MTLVEAVVKAVAELYFGYEFEERQIEVAAHAEFYHSVKALELYEGLILTSKIDHGRDAADEVGTVVVEAQGGELDIDRHGQVSVFHILSGFTGIATVVQVVQIAKYKMLGAEVHLRSEAKREMLAETPICQYAYAESRVPGVVITENGARGAIIYQLWAYVAEGGILQIETDTDAEVQWAQVNVGLVLHFARLALCCDRQQQA